MNKFFSAMLFLVMLCLLVVCGEQKKPEMQTEETPAMQMQEDSTQVVELAENMAIDPVCKMKLNKEETKLTVEHDGVTYYFCMEADKQAFVENPAKYLTAAK